VYLCARELIFTIKGEAGFGRYLVKLFNPLLNKTRQVFSKSGLWVDGYAQKPFEKNLFQY